MAGGKEHAPASRRAVEVEITGVAFTATQDYFLGLKLQHVNGITTSHYQYLVPARAIHLAAHVSPQQDLGASQSLERRLVYTVSN